MCIWSERKIAKCWPLWKEFPHQLCCLRLLPGVTDRTRMRKGGGERRTDEGEETRTAFAGLPLLVCSTYASCSKHTTFKQTALHSTPADVSVNHSPQQKGMLFVYKCAPFGALQRAFIHFVQPMSYRTNCETAKVEIIDLKSFFVH